MCSCDRGGLRARAWGASAAAQGAPTDRPRTENVRGKACRKRSSDRPHSSDEQAHSRALSLSETEAVLPRARLGLPGMAILIEHEVKPMPTEKEESHITEAFGVRKCPKLVNQVRSAKPRCA